MYDFEHLLKIQNIDTKLGQLEYRRGHDATVQHRDELRARRAEVTKQRAVVQSRRDELTSQLEALDAVATEAHDKAAKIHASMYDGSVVGHKELEAMQHELAMLKERQNDYEDAELEVMELAEPIDQELQALDEQLAALAAELEHGDAQVTIMLAEVDAHCDELHAERTPLAESTPPEILGEYEALRSRLGQGAARLAAGGKCEGCHLTIPSAEYAAIKRAPADEMIHCPECTRILVRP